MHPRGTTGHLASLCIYFLHVDSASWPSYVVLMGELVPQCQQQHRPADLHLTHPWRALAMGEDVCTFLADGLSPELNEDQASYTESSHQTLTLINHTTSTTFSSPQRRPAGCTPAKRQGVRAQEQSSLPVWQGFIARHLQGALAQTDLQPGHCRKLWC